MRRERRVVFLRIVLPIVAPLLMFLCSTQPTAVLAQNIGDNAAYGPSGTMTNSKAFIDSSAFTARESPSQLVARQSGTPGLRPVPTFRAGAMATVCLRTLVNPEACIRTRRGNLVARGICVALPTFGAT